MADEQKYLFDQIEEFVEQGNHSQLQEMLGKQRTSDIAEVIELLDNEERRIVFDALHRSAAAEVLEKVDEATRSELFELFGEVELLRLISELDPDDAADVLAELSEEHSEDVLERMPADEARQIKGLMSYSEDSAGGIMDPDLVVVHENATVGEAINEIRSQEVDENFFSVYVVNRFGHFLGDIRIRSLITCREDTLVKQLINTNAIYVRIDTDQEEVRNIFRKNDLIVVPVLDEENKLVGRITADRVIEVAEEEAAEDIFVMAGTDAAELENVSVVHAARVRMTWLLPCLFGTAVTAVLYIVFKSVFIESNFLSIYLVAIAFGPMIAAISGNAGLQTSAIVVSGLATGDLAALDLRQVFTREVRVALLVALSCGILGGCICALLPSLVNTGSLVNDANGGMIDPLVFSMHLRIVVAFATAMFGAIMVSTTLGLFLPFFFRSVGIDPAISSGPLVTTANDSISVAIYLSLTLLLV